MLNIYMVLLCFSRQMLRNRTEIVWFTISILPFRSGHNSCATHVQLELKHELNYDHVTLFPKGNEPFLKLPFFWGRVYLI